MRRSLTMGRPHGKKSFELVHSDAVPFTEQLAEFKTRVSAGKVDAKFAEVEIWTSDRGAVKRAKFSAPPKKQA